MLVQGIAVAVKAVFGNHHAHGCAVEGDSPATGLDEVRNGIHGAHVVIDDHAAGVECGTDAVIEHQGHSCGFQVLEMVVALGIFGLGDDDAAHLVAEH